MGKVVRIIRRYFDSRREEEEERERVGWDDGRYFSAQFNKAVEEIEKTIILRLLDNIINVSARLIV